MSCKSSISLESAGVLCPELFLKGLLSVAADWLRWVESLLTFDKGSKQFSDGVGSWIQFSLAKDYLNH
jgi:hypothetical protein